MLNFDFVWLFYFKWNILYILKEMSECVFFFVQNLTYLCTCKIMLCKAIEFLYHFGQNMYLFGFQNVRLFFATYFVQFH